MLATARPAALAVLCASLAWPGAAQAARQEPVRAAACSEAARAAGWSAPAVQSAAGERLDLARLVERLAAHRVVFVGEIHDRYDHHLNQLEIICGLRRHGPLAVGLEFLPATAQRALDAYLHGHGDLGRLLRESGWFRRWGFDARLYAPILRFAREHRIALVALNVPGELVRKVARAGMASLDRAARAQLPASIAEGPPAYRARLRRAFEQHPGHEQRRFEHFVEAQALWDEGMAQRAAEFLLEHPSRRLVVLAGEGHVAHGGAIPDRLARRGDWPQALVLQSHQHAPRPQATGFRLLGARLELPPAGRLGVRVQEGEARGVRIAGFAARSAARDAGLAEGDRLLALDERRLGHWEDLRLALWRKAPGDMVTLCVQRAGAVWRVALALR